MGFDYTDIVFKIKVTTLQVEDEDGKKKTVPYTGIDHAVLNALANRANNDTGKCWPGYGVLAEDTHFSRRAVMRAVAKLEQFGFISTEIPDERSTNTYTLHMCKLVAVSLLAPAKKIGKGKELRGKYTRKKLDLYPPGHKCSCGEMLTDCDCA
jgi:Helix-turn-helix domain